MRPPRPPQPPGSRLAPTRAERSRWQAAADRLGMTLNEFVRGAVNLEAEGVLQTKEGPSELDGPVRQTVNR